jgi:hypothetical protein
VLLLRGELAVGVDVAFADLLPGGEELAARALGEGFGADRVEQVVGGVQLVAGVEPAVLPAEPLTVEQAGPGQSEPSIAVMADSRPSASLARSARPVLAAASISSGRTSCVLKGE